MHFFRNHQRLNLSAYPGLEVHACEFSKDNYSGSLFEEHNISKPDFIAKYVQSRKSEFIAGRYCAQMALSHLGIQGVEVKKLTDQSPQWPAGLAGSISHCGNYAISAVADKKKYAFIGIDCETIISCATRQEIRNIVINIDELELITEKIADLNLATTLALSIKESFFKAIFPATKLHVDFNDIDIVDISSDQNYFQINCTQRITDIINRQTFRVHYFQVNATTICTLLAA